MSMRLWAALCLHCDTWHYVDVMALVWQESEGVFRGVCEICESELERKAKELDWSIDGRDG